MTTHTFFPTVARLLAVAAISIGAMACGGELLRTGRAPVYLIVQQVEAQQGTGSFSAFLLSDVRTTSGSAFNDNLRVTLRLELKNPTIEATAINNVSMTSYSIQYRRTDGQNEPGRHVPYGISGALAGMVVPGATSTVSFEIVRHQAKFEPPLANLVGAGGAVFISAIADVTLYGRDQNGNEVSVTTSVDIHFGDYGDDE